VTAHLYGGTHRLPSCTDLPLGFRADPQEANMFDSPPMRSIPRAHRDPLRTSLDALLLIMLLLEADAHDETMVLVLDDERRGTAVMRVTGTGDPDSLLGVVDHVTETSRASPDAAGLILVSARASSAISVDDLRRWHEADASCTDADLDLIEWFVVSNEVSCPRELCGIAPRWAA
jgi:hypothetical protein